MKSYSRQKECAKEIIGKGKNEKQKKRIIGESGNIVMAGKKSIREYQNSQKFW